MASRKLAEIAKTIRSKNAGVDKITFDVIFPDRTSYAQVRESGVLSRESVCRMFGIAAAQISDYVEFDPALAIKFTIYRRTPSGNPGDVVDAVTGYSLGCKREAALLAQGSSGTYRSTSNIAFLERADRPVDTID
jgi:hypothetical protein